jgi:hypothetical protein
MTEFTPSCDLILTGETVSSTESYSSCGSITAGPDFQIVAPGDVELRAATFTVMRNGFSIGMGASFTAEIDPALAGP